MGQSLRVQTQLRNYNVSLLFRLISSYIQRSFKVMGDSLLSHRKTRSQFQFKWTWSDLISFLKVACLRWQTMKADQAWKWWTPSDVSVGRLPWRFRKFETVSETHRATCLLEKWLRMRESIHIYKTLKAFSLSLKMFLYIKTNSWMYSSINRYNSVDFHYIHKLVQSN